jgi:hypothetical protein
VRQAADRGQDDPGKDPHQGTKPDHDAVDTPLQARFKLAHLRPQSALDLIDARSEGDRYRL